VLWGGGISFVSSCFHLSLFLSLLFLSTPWPGIEWEGGRECASEERWKDKETKGLCRSACAPQTKLRFCPSQRSFPASLGGVMKVDVSVGKGGREGKKGGSLFAPTVFTCASLCDSPEENK